VLWDNKDPSSTTEGKKTMKISMFFVLLSLSVFAKGSKNSDENFFEKFDALVEIQESELSVSNKVFLDRYNKLYARLSVYALICDRGNKMGYSTAVSEFGQINKKYFKDIEKAHGVAKAEDRFENLRNKYSREIYSVEDQRELCDKSYESFKNLVAMNAGQTKKLLSVKEEK
jgi:hypothetical protein